MIKATQNAEGGVDRNFSSPTLPISKAKSSPDLELHGGDARRMAYTQFEGIRSGLSVLTSCKHRDKLQYSWLRQNNSLLGKCKLNDWQLQEANIGYCQTPVLGQGFSPRLRLGVDFTFAW